MNLLRWMRLSLMGRRCALIMERIVGIGIQDFSKIQKENVFYGDKTQFIRRNKEVKESFEKLLCRECIDTEIDEQIIYGGWILMKMPYGV